MQNIDPNTCRQARLSRDPRFDGEFFLAVTSTGIYCRPVCPARPPRESNVRYYRTAAEASQQGFRPCLRCRPESAPSSPAWQGTSTTVARAMQLINEGCLNEQPLSALADRLGVGERYLRKLFRQQVGASPGVVAQTQRLHFAQKLLAETDLPLTDIAFASGFGSVRRFNSATQEKFGCTPGQMRRKHTPTTAGTSTIKLQLSYRPPYDWDGVLDFYNRHAIAGIESVDGECYQRNIDLGDGAGRMLVRPGKASNALQLELQLPDTRYLVPVVSRVRRMFDLDANPASIEETLASEPLFATLVARFPGTRSATQWAPFEACVRAIVGQQVSVAAARRVCARLVESCANSGDLNGESVALFPTAEQLLALPESDLPMPTARRQTLRTLCNYFSEHPGAIDEDPTAALLDLRGIGPWTCAMISMRGYGDPDIFPASDLGLVKAAQDLDTDITKRNHAISERWRPWRSYAANLLWRHLCT